MRLDQFLKASRIIKRRSIAKAICDSNRVMINDHIAKAGKEVHEGDIIRLSMDSGILTFQVISIPNRNISITSASSIYKVIPET